jgi:hypothetical protein
MTFVGGTTYSLNEPAYKKPFDFLAENNQMAKQKKAASRTKNGLFENWLPGRDSNPRPIG